MIEFLVIEDASRPPGLMNTRQPRPSWEDIEASIVAMDGNDRSLVMMCASDDCGEFMGIGGERGDVAAVL